MTIVIDTDENVVVSRSDGSDGQNVRMAAEVEHYVNSKKYGSFDDLQAVTDAGMVDIESVLPNAIIDRCYTLRDLRAALNRANRAVSVLEQCIERKMTPRQLYHETKKYDKLCMTYWKDSQFNDVLPTEYDIADKLYNDTL